MKSISKEIVVVILRVQRAFQFVHIAISGSFQQGIRRRGGRRQQEGDLGAQLWQDPAAQRRFPAGFTHVLPWRELLRWLGEFPIAEPQEMTLSIFEKYHSWFLEQWQSSEEFAATVLMTQVPEMLLPMPPIAPEEQDDTLPASVSWLNSRMQCVGRSPVSVYCLWIRTRYEICSGRLEKEGRCHPDQGPEAVWVLLGFLCHRFDWRCSCYQNWQTGLAKVRRCNYLSMNVTWKVTNIEKKT